MVENSKPVSRILIFIMESMLKEVAAAAEGTASTWNSSSLHPGIQERVAGIVVGYSLALLQRVD